ncbi:GntR family transcriptional regulator, partial [Pseudomonas syringae pv. actinidifoliorum]|nr:GntR family transcriptional regulator [Pseudomonas syringae pv. actinidifoliorum]
VGTANMMFHKAIVELADSPRLTAFYGQISAELRLAFGLLNNPELLHSPYLDMNAAVLGCLDAGKTDEATRMLEDYLVQSERTILAAFQRNRTGSQA